MHKTPQKAPIDSGIDSLDIWDKFSRCIGTPSATQMEDTWSNGSIQKKYNSVKGGRK